MCPTRTLAHAGEMIWLSSVGKDFLVGSGEFDCGKATFCWGTKQVTFERQGLARDPNGPLISFLAPLLQLLGFQFGFNTI